MHNLPFFTVDLFILNKKRRKRCVCVLEGGVQFHTNYDLLSGLSWACLKVCAVEIQSKYAYF